MSSCSKTSKDTADKIISMKNAGTPSREIAKVLGVGKSTVNDIYNRSKVTEKVPYRILLLDIETASSIVATFGRFKQNIGQAAVIKEGGWIISYAYKWLGGTGVDGSRVTESEAMLADDSRVCAELWELLEQSDACVWHNGANFDLPMIKARMIVNGLPPVRKVKSIDTLSIAREFRFNSSKLDSLCSQLDIGRKTNHAGMSMWIDCQNGDTVALDKMLEYNLQDVVLLEELYLIIRRHSTRHPNLAIYYNDDKVRCNICCSDDVKLTGNLVTTNVSIFEEYVCNECQGRFKSRQSITTKEQRSNFLSN